MKRKNILKFVSLLGIGSFVMLAAASCTTPTPNPTPNPNPPSGGMNGGDTNPGDGQGMMNAASQELEAARMGLTTVFDSKAKNLGLYVDYKKTQQNLTKAYDAAKTVLDNSSSTTQNLNEAKTRLETAIRTAATSKQTFDEQHAELVKVYKELKTTLSNETATLAPYEEAQYAGIKMHLSGLYDAGKAITTKTLEPVEGDPLTADVVMMANTKIVEAIKDEVLNPQKENATKLADSFVKQVLVKEKITGVEEAHNKAQPANYSFVGYSVDITGTTTGQTSIPNWDYAQRTIFTNGDEPRSISNTPADGQTMAQPLSNVSWIYSLAGTGAKYTLEFTYYGPSTGYLYFPYKLVNTSDQMKLGLEYKLNDATEPSTITFGSEQTMNGKTPTVNDINVAKVTLANLKFGSNKIEFSVPAEKVSPMIGNMYLSSSPNNWNKIYDDIFGNSVTTENNRTIISVDALNGYSLASDWSTYIAEYSGAGLTLNDQAKPNEKYYLIGYVGGTGARNDMMVPKNNVQKFPLASNTTNRNYVFYVNAPKAGAYYIKGVFASGDPRNLKFSAGDMSSNNSVTIEQLSTDNLTTLRTFDTSATTAPTQVTTVANNRKTLTLVEGLNKIVVSGATANIGSAPNFGYLEFILNETQPETTNDSNPS
ncbi:variably expressed lipoprotein and hemagglutinin (VlhA) family protein [Mycoplasmoides gallisepticum str. F]|uniref:FIVAR domain-containing protein n=1 Tax=Mycoplasmoides gallisepticum TaxID=2096 RepID=UPI0001C399EE|nr:FIVAR domain-containing protein [Mycoplasmoides gallisepticum]ADC31148.1 variably expressed lipoprotein and hemagglutinin (VlhA) family protein [Mycoplasmoides gallisepticum str. F]